MAKDRRVAAMADYPALAAHHIDLLQRGAPPETEALLAELERTRAVLREEVERVMNDAVALGVSVRCVRYEEW